MVVSVLKKVTEGGISSSTATNPAGGSSMRGNGSLTDGTSKPVNVNNDSNGMNDMSSTSLAATSNAITASNAQATTNSDENFESLSSRVDPSVGMNPRALSSSQIAREYVNGTYNSRTKNGDGSTHNGEQTNSNFDSTALVVNHSNSDDSYFGKFSEYITDSYTYAKDTVVGSFTSLDSNNTAAHSLSQQFYNIASPATPTNLTPSNSKAELKHDSDQINKSRSQTLSGGFGKKKSSRSWFKRRSVYDSVTGRSGHRPLPNNSVTAVRNLVQLVKVEESSPHNSTSNDLSRSSSSSNISLNEEKKHQYNYNQQPLMESIESNEEALFEHGITERTISESDLFVDTQAHYKPSSFLSPIHHDEAQIEHDENNNYTLKDNLKSPLPLPSSKNFKNKKISNEETASRLGEGTIRALRDIALDEALELHQCLRFWSERLERPALFYLEFAPRLIFAKDEGHLLAGQNVSQLQAVLARRCSSIGELQQHLWRAGWQSGVAQWGILGQGSEFAAVIGGGHGEIEEQPYHQHQESSSKSLSGDRRLSFFSSIRRDRDQVPANKRRGKSGQRNVSDYTIDSLLHVMNQKGGKIMKNDSALAAWSIDAIRVVRDHLYNAGSGVAPLPSYENWPREKTYFTSNDKNQLRERRRPTLGDSMMSMEDAHLFNHDKDTENDLPLWATTDVEQEHLNSLNERTAFGDEADNLILEGGESNASGKEKITEFTITNIELMADEVNGILNSMEKYMSMQKKRRLLKLKPPSRLSRKWYLIAVVVPVTGYVAYKLFQGNEISKLASEIYAKIGTFFSEHLSEPIESIYRELFTRKGREEITDRKARKEVISSLKKMIKNWLDDAHPDMSEQERIHKANSMDMQMIEATKEHSIQNIMEISTIYRLSLIEMQFLKKEMMNALYAMDELMGSNEINMRLTSMTPAFMLVSSIQYVIKKLYYALFKLGKSKEEVYASFRHIILDIERLLVMRDNPPLSLPPLSTGVQYHHHDKEVTSPKRQIEEYQPAYQSLNQSQPQPTHQTVLSADDLGMLMLLVHECTQILWQDRRRFTRQELRNVSEDLAELAGERGAVSVQQQLRIIARMCRTYSFLKVISSGIPFSVDDSFVS